MSLHFYPLKVKAIKKETSDCVSIVFDVPQNLQSNFKYTQGQNLTLRKTINGEDVRRSYSICTAPHENEVKVAVKKVDGGLFSTFANNELQIGDILDVMPPTGKFYTALNINNKKNYLAIAAGSGITPILGIIKATLKTEPQSNFTLVYGNKNQQSIVFFEELEALKNMYINRFVFINILSRERLDTALNVGRINKEKLKELGKLIKYENIDEAFICGPEEMIFCSKDFLEEKGIDKKKIHFELFGTVRNKLAIDKEQLTKEKTTVAKSNITIKLDGRSFDFTLSYNDENILDAALKQGADLPYACKGGMCCTCKAKLLQGEVTMDVSWGLEQEEIEQGFILTCQSHPKTEKVVVDFDVK
ncbi:MAG: phenylacetate-CoA oxygenase/reductase subunit PaaK [Chitinophagaceae bacterium]|nr:phenylacetate-CoA oxygenase/reductase subunit PaaK [Chitinophagaceae bacterium]